MFLLFLKIAATFALGMFSGSLQVKDVKTRKDVPVVKWGIVIVLFCVSLCIAFFIHEAP